MADQTTIVGGNGRSEAPATAVRRGMSGFAHDLATLAELQINLFTTDTKECVNKIILPFAAIAVGLVLLLGCLPVLLLGLAELMVQAEWLSEGWAYLVTAIAAAVIAVIASYVGYIKVRTSLTTFQRSKEELIENLNWLKRMLKHQAGSPSPHAPRPPHRS